MRADGLAACRPFPYSVVFPCRFFLLMKYESADMCHCWWRSSRCQWTAIPEEAINGTGEKVISSSEGRSSPLHSFLAPLWRDPSYISHTRCHGRIVAWCFVLVRMSCVGSWELLGSKASCFVHLHPPFNLFWKFEIGNPRCDVAFIKMPGCI